ncbi:MAG: hypothetical protein Q8Q06_02970 [bacterium]|nr:hypothetical protein [bacterium]
MIKSFNSSYYISEVNMGALIGLAFVAFVFGYFLQTAVLVFATATSIVMSLYLVVSREGMERFIMFGLFVNVVIFNGIMWVTNYMVTGQGWINDFVSKYILR